MTDDLKIHVMLLGELPWLLPFWAGAAGGESPTDDVTRNNILLKQRDDAVLIAEINGQMVGTVIAVFDGWRGNIYGWQSRPTIASGVSRDG
jgi:hypothetical protein